MSRTAGLVRLAASLAAASLAAASLAAAFPAAAQTVDDLVACAAISRDAERLTCYDAKVAAASPAARAAAERRAVESARLRANDAAAAAAAELAQKAAARAARKADFGGETITARGDERFKPDPEQVQEVETTLTEQLTNSQGTNVFLLGNGQAWRQVDTASLPNLHNGDAVKLSRAALGGFHLKFLRSKRFVAVRRVR
jgi:hypothetical protein